MSRVLSSFIKAVIVTFVSIILVLLWFTALSSFGWIGYNATTIFWFVVTSIFCLLIFLSLLPFLGIDLKALLKRYWK